MYFLWLNFKDIMKDFIHWLRKLLFILFDIIRLFLYDTFLIFRLIVYKVLCVVSIISSIVFIIGLYYIYKCYVEYKNGITFFDMKNLNYAVILIFVPIVLAVIKEIVRPKEGA